MCKRNHCRLNRKMLGYIKTLLTDRKVICLLFFECFAGWLLHTLCDKSLNLLFTGVCRVVFQIKHKQFILTWNTIYVTLNIFVWSHSFLKWLNRYYYTVLYTYYIGHTLFGKTKVRDKLDNLIILRPQLELKWKNYNYYYRKFHFSRIPLVQRWEQTCVHFGPNNERSLKIYKLLIITTDFWPMQIVKL